MSCYNFYFKKGMQDWDKESLTQMKEYLEKSEEILFHGITARQDCFGVLLLEVPWAGNDEEKEIRSHVIFRCEEIRNQVGQLQLMEMTQG